MSSYDIDDPPSSVMVTAVRPVNGSDSLGFQWESEYQNQQIYVYFYFAEIEQLKDGQLREFQIYLNNEPSGPVVNPIYLQLSTIYGPGSELDFSIRATDDSTLPPILNAVEIYEVLLLQSPTNQSEGEVNSIYYSYLKYSNNLPVQLLYPFWTVVGP